MLLPLTALVVAAGLALPGPASSRGTEAAAGEVTPGLSEARAAAEQAAQEYAEAEAALGELSHDLARLEAERDQAEAEIAALRDDVAAIVVEQYVDAGTAPPLVSGDPNEQALAGALARLVTQRDVDAIDDYRAARARADAASAEIEARMAEQEALLDQLDDAQARLEEELARLEAMEQERLAAEQRQAAEAARRAADAASRQEAQEQADTLSRMQAARRAGEQAESAPSGQVVSETPAGPVVPSTGGMVCPVPGSTFVDSYGAPRPQGWAHQGVDMMASSGTPILAPVSGTVEHRGNTVGGLAFHLTGSDGRYYYGAHLSAYGNAGSVSAGTVIGYVGNTGDAAATAPHLHLEIHIGGVPVNPYPYVAAVC